MSFGPSSSGGALSQLFNTSIGTNSTNAFGFPMSADELRQNYSALTIQTAPEEAQAVIANIKNLSNTENPYLLAKTNCTTVCRDALKVIRKLAAGNKNITPKAFWKTAYGQYGSSFDMRDNANHPLTGVDYGHRSANYDPFSVFQLLTEPDHSTVTTSQGDATPCGGSPGNPCSK
jgi:methionyl-tRNA synthetase